MSGADRDRQPEVQGGPAPYSQKEVRRANRAFRMLSREHRDMVWMLQVENLSYPEIGERLGIALAEVERRAAAAIYAWCRAYEQAKRPWWRFW